MAASGVNVLPSAPSILLVQVLPDSPQYQDQETFSLPVTSAPEEEAVAMIFLPSSALELTSSATLVTLTEPEAAMTLVARVV